MARRNATLERPATFVRTRAVADPGSREAHLMPSVVEQYGKPRPAAAPSETSAPPLRAPPVSVETLQTLIRHLVVDSQFARHMEVSPARTINEVPYLTEREKRTLSSLDPQVIQSLADAAQRYARAIGPKQQIGPAGISMRSDPLGRIGQLDDFGPRGRGRGGDGARQLPPDVARRFGRGGGSADLSTDGGAWGDDGTGGFGGLGRGWFSGRDIPGVGGSGPDLESFGDRGMGPQRDFGQDAILGLLAGMGRGPFGSDPLVNARAWHRLHPGGAASEGDEKPPPPPPSEPKGGSKDQKAQLQQAADRDKEKAAQEAGKREAEWGGKVGGVFGAGFGAIGGRSVMSAAIGAVVGAAAGASVGYAAGYWHYKFTHRPADDATGSGPGGPRMQAFMPADDGTGPVGPWAHQAPMRGALYMPAPDDPGGGGPWSNVFKPNPDDPGPGTPHSRAAAALNTMVSSAAMVLAAGRRL